MAKVSAQPTLAPVGRTSLWWTPPDGRLSFAWPRRTRSPGSLPLMDAHPEGPAKNTNPTGAKRWQGTGALLPEESPLHLSAAFMIGVPVAVIGLLSTFRLMPLHLGLNITCVEGGESGCSPLGCSTSCCMALLHAGIGHRPALLYADRGARARQPDGGVHPEQVFQLHPVRPSAGSQSRPFNLVAPLSARSHHRAIIHMLFSGEGSVKSQIKSLPDPGAAHRALPPPLGRTAADAQRGRADEAFKKTDSVETVEIIFIRHGESTWNEIFNKARPNHSRCFSP